MSNLPGISEPITRDSPSKLLKEELLRTTTDKGNKKMTNPLKLPEIFNYFDTPNREKKWAAPSADLTDYFNYGLTEETFKIYAQKVKHLYTRLQKTGGAHFKNMGESDKFYEDKVPISHGGLEIIDDKNLKQLLDDPTYLLIQSSELYVKDAFEQPENREAIVKGIASINDTVNNVYGLKKDPPPSVNVQPPPSINPGLPRPQPPGVHQLPGTVHHPPPRVQPPPLGMPNLPNMPPNLPPNMPPNMPNMYGPPMHHMEYPNFPPRMPNPMQNFNPYQKPDFYNPQMMPPHMMPGARMPMEMPMPDADMGRKPEKRRKDEKSESSDDEDSDDERSKDKSQSKTSEKRKRSRSREKKHKHHHKSEKENGGSEQSSKHHKDRHDRDDRSRKNNYKDYDNKSSRRDDRSSREREREESKYEDGDAGTRQGSKKGNWQLGLINKTIGKPQKDGKEKDRKEKKHSR